MFRESCRFCISHESWIQYVLGIRFSDFRIKTLPRVARGEIVGFGDLRNLCFYEFLRIVESRTFIVWRLCTSSKSQFTEPLICRYCAIRSHLDCCSSWFPRGRRILGFRCFWDSRVQQFSKVRRFGFHGSRPFQFSWASSRLVVPCRALPSLVSSCLTLILAIRPLNRSPGCARCAKPHPAALPFTLLTFEDKASSLFLCPV